MIPITGGCARFSPVCRQRPGSSARLLGGGQRGCPVSAWEGEELSPPRWAQLCRQSPEHSLLGGRYWIKWNQHSLLSRTRLPHSFSLEVPAPCSPEPSWTLALRRRIPARIPLGGQPEWFAVFRQSRSVGSVEAGAGPRCRVRVRCGIDNPEHRAEGTGRLLPWGSPSRERPGPPGRGSRKGLLGGMSLVLLPCHSEARGGLGSGSRGKQRDTERGRESRRGDGTERGRESGRDRALGKPRADPGKYFRSSPDPISAVNTIPVLVLMMAKLRLRNRPHPLSHSFHFPPCF